MILFVSANKVLFLSFISIYLFNLLKTMTEIMKILEGSFHLLVQVGNLGIIIIIALS